MATPPTVLASAISPAPPGPHSPPRVPIVPLLIAVLAGVLVALLGVGGSIVYLTRTGRLPMGRAAVSKPDKAAPVATHVMSLDPLLVNLADAGGTGYLRVSIALRVADATGKSAPKNDEKATPDAAGNSEPVIAARDTALMVLGRQTSDALLASGGKERLKAELKVALDEHDPEIKVQNVFFTDFLVQR